MRLSYNERDLRLPILATWPEVEAGAPDGPSWRRFLLWTASKTVSQSELEIGQVPFSLFYSDHNSKAKGLCWVVLQDSSAAPCHLVLVSLQYTVGRNWQEPVLKKPCGVSFCWFSPQQHAEENWQVVQSWDGASQQGAPSPPHFFLYSSDELNWSCRVANGFEPSLGLQSQQKMWQTRTEPLPCLVQWVSKHSQRLICLPCSQFLP